MTTTSLLDPLRRVRPRPGTARTPAPWPVRRRRDAAPVPPSWVLQVPSPRTMDPDEDAEFERRFRDE